MKIFCSAQPVMLALAAAFILTVSGCSGNGAKPSPTPEAVGTFTGQDLPEIVEELEGTPLYSESTKLAPLAKLDGATYLLIAPQDPLKALLVVEEDTKPEDVVTRKSAIVKLAGKRETLKNEALVAHVKEQYQLDLKTNDTGEIIVLRVAAQDAPAAEATTPATPAPAVSATPATEQTPQDESTPNVE